jgi:hypothetical protein
VNSLERALNTVCKWRNGAYKKRWPGVTATLDDLSYDFQRIQREGWMKGWRP